MIFTPFEQLSLSEPLLRAVEEMGFTGLTELTLRDVSGALDWSALGSLPLQTVTTDAMQADAIRASGTTATVTVTD